MGAVADVAPPCLVRCAPGYRGLPVARCLSQGGFFTLEGCAAPSIEWTQHGQVVELVTTSRTTSRSIRVVSVSCILDVWAVETFVEDFGHLRFRNNGFWVSR